MKSPAEARLVDRLRLPYSMPQRPPMTSWIMRAQRRALAPITNRNVQRRDHLFPVAGICSRSNSAACSYDSCSVAALFIPSSFRIPVSRSVVISNKY